MAIVFATVAMVSFAVDQTLSLAPNAEELLNRMLNQAAPADSAESLPDDVTALAVRRTN